MNETLLVSVRMDLCELSRGEGAEFKYDGDDVRPVVIPMSAWVDYGRPTQVKVRIFAVTEATDE